MVVSDRCDQRLDIYISIYFVWGLISRSLRAELKLIYIQKQKNIDRCKNRHEDGYPHSQTAKWKLTIHRPELLANHDRQHHTYFSCVFSDTQISHSNSLFGFKLLTWHVDVVCILVFIIWVSGLLQVENSSRCTRMADDTQSTHLHFILLVNLLFIQMVHSVNLHNKSGKTQPSEILLQPLEIKYMYG